MSTSSISTTIYTLSIQDASLNFSIPSSDTAGAANLYTSNIYLYWNTPLKNACVNVSNPNIFTASYYNSSSSNVNFTLGVLVFDICEIYWNNTYLCTFDTSSNTNSNSSLFPSSPSSTDPSITTFPTNFPSSTNAYYYFTINNLAFTPNSNNTFTFYCSKKPNSISAYAGFACYLIDNSIGSVVMRTDISCNNMGNGNGWKLNIGGFFTQGNTLISKYSFNNNKFNSYPYSNISSTIYTCSFESFYNPNYDLMNLYQYSLPTGAGINVAPNTANINYTTSILRKNQDLGPDFSFCQPVFLDSSSNTNSISVGWYYPVVCNSYNIIFDNTNNPIPGIVINNPTLNQYNTNYINYIGNTYGYYSSGYNIIKFNSLIVNTSHTISANCFGSAGNIRSNTITVRTTPNPVTNFGIYLLSPIQDNAVVDMSFTNTPSQNGYYYQINYVDMYNNIGSYQFSYNGTMIPYITPSFNLMFDMCYNYSFVSYDNSGSISYPTYPSAPIMGNILTNPYAPSSVTITPSPGNITYGNIHLNILDTSNVNIKNMNYVIYNGSTVIGNCYGIGGNPNGTNFDISNYLRYNTVYNLSLFSYYITDIYYSSPSYPYSYNLTMGPTAPTSITTSMQDITATITINNTQINNNISSYTLVYYNINQITTITHNVIDYNSNSNIFNLTTLIMNTQYSFYAYLTNTNGINSPNSSIYTAYTLIPSPTITVTTQNTTSIIFNDETNYIGLTSYVIILYTSSAYTGTTINSSTTAISGANNKITVSGLTENTQYWYQIVATNTNNTSGQSLTTYGSSNLANTYTKPNTPSSVTITPSYLYSATVSIISLIPSLTYYINYGQQMTNLDTTFTITSVSSTITNLSKGIKYYYNIFCMDKNSNLYSANSDTSSFTMYDINGTKTGSFFLFTSGTNVNITAGKINDTAMIYSNITLKYELVGGGGGGGGSYSTKDLTKNRNRSNCFSGAGGGGGKVSTDTITTSSLSYSISIGSGGKNGGVTTNPNVSTNGGDGTASTFTYSSTLITSEGGKGGYGGSATNTIGGKSGSGKNGGGPSRYAGGGGGGDNSDGGAGGGNGNGGFYGRGTVGSVTSYTAGQGGGGGANMPDGATTYYGGGSTLGGASYSGGIGGSNSVNQNGTNGNNYGGGGGGGGISSGGDLGVGGYGGNGYLAISIS